MNVTSALTVNSDRLNQHLAELAQIGALADGGVKRIAFSPEDLQARRQVQAWMSAAEMSTRIDAAGNLIGRYPGLHAMPSLATGSHIDTVPTGGRYDGALGVLAGIEAVQSLSDRRIHLNHPIEVIVFADEEGSMIGSKAMSGSVGAALYPSGATDGTLTQAGVSHIGGDGSQLHTARRSRAEIVAYVELHVEQGGILELLDRQIGVVQGVVGQQRYQITAIGSPNHAGTTPMEMRQDALLAAAQIVQAVNEIARRTPGDPVATIGSMQIFPNAHNIIPGRVEMMLDVRAMSMDRIDSILQQLVAQMEIIAQTTNTQLSLALTTSVAPTPASEKIQKTIGAVCEDFQLSWQTMPSRAVHDAQEIGRFTDMGMIFVPSQGGVSHAEIEYTTPEQCVQGTNVLLHTLMRLDRIF